MLTLGFSGADKSTVFAPTNAVIDQGKIKLKFQTKSTHKEKKTGVCDLW
jgi:hypothetical protein